MATIEQVVLRGEKRIVLSHISWELYEQLRENEDNWHIHMAYDNGRLEHESLGRPRSNQEVARPVD